MASSQERNEANHEQQAAETSAVALMVDRIITRIMQRLGLDEASRMETTKRLARGVELTGPGTVNADEKKQLPEVDS